MFSRPALEKLKIDGEYYDEDFFMFWEDFDIGWRASLLGLKVFFVPGAVAYHFRSGTLAGTGWARFSLALARPAPLRFHLVKNRYLTLIKNFRLAPLLVDAAVRHPEGPALGRRIDNPLAQNYNRPGPFRRHFQAGPGKKGS